MRTKEAKVIRKDTPNAFFEDMQPAGAVDDAVTFNDMNLSRPVLKVIID